MRLIDADALSDLLVETYEKAPTEKALLFVALLLKNNEQVSTVEERPQGEWTIVNDVYCECPFCKNREVKFSKYCPECGARLKGDKS